MHRSPNLIGPLSACLLWILLPAVWGCGTEAEGAGQETPPLEAIDVPVPPADGPELIILRDGTEVRDRPALESAIVGTLRLGARVVRAAEPYTTKGCEGGWYPIRPRGFVCAGTDATIATVHPVAQLLGVPPALDRPLPYRYGRVRRGATVIYPTLPSREEQRSAEPKLDRREPPESVRLGAGANDVPLDERGWPTGPPVVLPTAEGVGADGYRTSAEFFRFPRFRLPSGLLAEGASLATLPQQGDEAAPGESPDVRVLRRHTGVALVGSFSVGKGDDARRFGVLPDGRFVPVDRLRAELGSTWHGVSLVETGLPLGFALRAGVRLRSLRGRQATVLDLELEPREPVDLTGRYRTVGGQRHYRTLSGHWVRHKDIILINRRHRFPEWATDEQKWLDISLANQTLVAYAGKKPLYATLISSGRDRLGDPASGPATQRGVFRIEEKQVTAEVDSREANQRYELFDVPWVMRFAESVALTGAYHRRRFGEALSYHNIALAPVDAHWLFHFCDPPLPAGWHGVVAAEDDPRTIVYVHK